MIVMVVIIVAVMVVVVIVVALVVVVIVVVMTVRLLDYCCRVCRMLINVDIGDDKLATTFL